MATSSSFNEFFSNIEPSKSTVEYIASIQQNIRGYLSTHNKYKDIYVESFLSGSYAKNTAIRPKKNKEKRDVDIIILTNYAREDSSKKIIDEILNVLKENKKYKSITKQKRSVSIEMNEIAIDIIPIIEINNKYYIGNSKVDEWIETNPKCHIEWSIYKNKELEGYYKKIVKTFKWWNEEHKILNVKFPKGITLEKLIADSFSVELKNIEEIIFNTMINVSNLIETFILLGLLIPLADPCLKENNLFHNYKILDLKKYNELLKKSQVQNLV